MSLGKPGFANSLLLRIGLLILFALAAFTLSFYHLIGKPTIERLAESQMRQISEQLDARLSRLLKTVEVTLRSSQGWTMHGDFDHAQLTRFNEFFFPIIANHGEISSVIFADQSGREILLLHSEDGRWINRISDPQNWGRQTYWITWSADQRIEKVEMRLLDYDARTRPWFTGALALNDAQSIHWTQPYIFYTTQDAGITAAMQWRGSDGTRYVIGHDVRLRDIAEYTTGLSLGKRGTAAMITDDGKLIAPPRDPRFIDPTVIKQALLKTPAALAIPELSAGYAAWQAKGQANNRLDSFMLPNDGRWFSLFRQIDSAGLKIWLGVLAPEEDFIPVNRQDLLLLALITLSCLALGMIVAIRLAQRFGQPLDALTEESERIGRLELEQPVTTKASWKEITQLASALESMRRHLQDARQAQQATHAELELKVAERTQALHRREAFFRAIFDNAAVGIVSFNAQLQPTRVNRAFADLIAYPIENLLREMGSKILPPSEQIRLQQALQAVASGQQKELRSEFELIGKTGETHWGDVQIAAIRNKNGHLDSLLVTVLDVTDRREIEAELIRQFSLLQALLDTLPNPIFYKGADTRFIGCNQAYEEFFGTQRANFIGKRVLDLDYLPEDIRHSYQAEDELVIMECRQVSREVPMTMANGSLRDTLYSVSGFRTPQGKPGGLIGVIVDITPLKNAEREAERARAAAEAASLAKADFLANMSHEIRTPMNAIIGMTHLALQTELTSRQRNYLSKVDNAAKGLLGIINDILDLSKIEAGMMLFERTPFSLDVAMRHLADMCAQKAREQGLELLFDISPEIPERLIGDPLRLGQVLLNLVGNAIKFTETGEVSVAIALVARHENELELRFEICDSGIGMTPEQQTQLFTAFTQADTSTTRKYGGTGLGLSICKRIVEQLGGKISVTSQPGVGSCFIFSLLFGLPSSEPSPPRRLGLPEGLRTLVVDDSPGAREIFSHMLQTLGMECHAAAGATEALRELSAARQAGHAYRLLIIDWKMPEVDGVALLARIREHNGDANKAVVIMTTAYDPDDLQAALGEETVGAILRKPATASTLFDSIVSALHHEPKKIAAVLDASPIHTRQFPGQRVLLVEDNEVNRELAEEMLTAVGLTVDLAENGAQAIERLQGRTYDLVLMDCQMPVMDGYEATRRIRNDLQNAQLPIIAMTANALASDRSYCLAAGMNDHIPKPIDVTILYNTLAHWLAAPPGAAKIPVTAEAMAQATSPSDLDIHAALARLGGNHKMLDRLLRRFRENQGQVIERLNAARTQQDKAAMILDAHTLRGLAGNIGAGKLSRLAGELEEALKQGAAADSEAIGRMIAVLGEALQAVLAMPESMALESAITPELPPSEAARQEALSHLQALLDNDDATAGRHFEKLAGWLRAQSDGRQLEQLARQIGRYEFAEALETLHQIRSTLIN